VLDFIEIEQLLENAATQGRGRRIKGLWRSSPGFPQSYPQQQWTVEKHQLDQ
jgi:hypothetical protein